MAATIIVWLVYAASIAGGYWLGKRRGRRGWLWGLLGPIGVVIVWLLPDLSKSPEQRGQEKSERQRGKAITKATVALEKAQARRTLAKYRSVVLYEDGLVTADGSCPLTPEIKASVQDAGTLQKYVTSRVTLTRVATIGIFALGAKKNNTHTVDTRELYLLVETPDFESLTTCSPNDGPKVRRLANAINNAAKRAAELRDEREARIAASQTALRELEGRNTAIAAPPATSR